MPPRGTLAILRAHLNGKCAAPSAVSAFSNRFSVFEWMGENDLETLRVDANFFENGKSCVFKRKRIRVDGALYSPLSRKYR